MSIRTDPRSRFSVVIPLFNAERYIARALGSIAQQTRPVREVVVVDDGSNDGGPDIAAAHASVHLIRQVNKGAGSARNAGVAATSTPWIAFLDADDLWLPNHLEALERIVDDVSDAALVSTSHREIPDHRVAMLLADGRSHPRIRQGRRIDYFVRAGRDIGVVCTSAAALRRDAFDWVGGFGDLNGPEDIHLWARMALQFPVAVSRSRTALYVRGTGGLMERATRKPANADVEWVPLTALTPSIRAVMAEQDTRRPEVPRSSIERYIDGRVTSNWRSVLIHAGQTGARRRWRELHRPFHPSALPFALAAWMPITIGRGAAAIRRALVARLTARHR